MRHTGEISTYMAKGRTSGSEIHSGRLANFRDLGFFVGKSKLLKKSVKKMEFSLHKEVVM